MQVSCATDNKNIRWYAEDSCQCWGKSGFGEGGVEGEKRTGRKKKGEQKTLARAHLALGMRYI